MNARLFVNVLRRREAAPAIVPFLFDAIDRIAPAAAPTVAGAGKHRSGQ